MRTPLDLSLPILLGTAWFSSGDEVAADASITTYLEAGGRVLDTARIYGESEGVIGGWLRRNGDVPGLQLLTKGAHPDPDLGLSRLGHDEVMQDARTSVDELGRPVDAYLLHRDDGVTSVEEVADTLRAVVDEGLTSAVGVSNWSRARAQALRTSLRARDLDLAAVSNYLGLALPSAPPDWAGEVSLDAESLAWLEKTGIPELAWSSQSGGYFAGAYGGHQFDGAENGRRRAVLDEVATLAGVRPSSVLARWSATISDVVVPVVASRSPERLARTIADMRDPDLDPVVDDLIAALDPDGSRGRALIAPGATW